METEKNGGRLMTGIVVLAGITMLGIVVIALFSPGDKQATYITSLVTVSGGIIAAFLMLLKLNETARLAGDAARLAAETARLAAEAVRLSAEQTAAAKRIEEKADAIKVEVDGKMSKLVTILEKNAAMSLEAGRDQGVKQERDRAEVEASSLAEALATPPPAVEEAPGVKDSVVVTGEDLHAAGPSKPRAQP